MAFAPAASCPRGKRTIASETPPKRDLRVVHGDATRKRIMEAAMDVASTEGLEALTIGLDFRLDDDPEDLADLADSIRELGVLQALVVRPCDTGWEVIRSKSRSAMTAIATLAGLR